jgi:hypothetical protein
MRGVELFSRIDLNSYAKAVRERCETASRAVPNDRQKEPFRQKTVEEIGEKYLIAIADFQSMQGNRLTKTSARRAHPDFDWGSITESSAFSVSFDGHRDSFFLQPRYRSGALFALNVSEKALLLSDEQYEKIGDIADHLESVRAEWDGHLKNLKRTIENLVIRA